jgi:hypothetical protein
MPTSIFAERSTLSPSAVIPAGGGTGLAAIGGVLAQSAVPVGTGANTNATDLWTYTMPANTLSADSYGVRITAYVTTAANANNKTVALTFGATTLVTTATAGYNNTLFIFTFTVYRTGASAQSSFGQYGRRDFGSGEGAPSDNFTYTTPAADTTAAIAIKIVGTNGTANANEIVFRGGTIEFLRTPA